MRRPKNDARDDAPGRNSDESCGDRVTGTRSFTPRFRNSENVEVPLE